MTILTDFGYLHLSLKKLYSDFSYTLAYVTLKYERNQIFHPCRDMFDFYGQALLRIDVIKINYCLNILFLI